MRKVDELLEEAKWGKLSSEELDYVAARIKASSPEHEDAELYRLIYILGRANASHYKNLVESFLFYPQDPMISKISLQVLCDCWAMEGRYLSELKKFVKGVDWDADEDVRIIAISSSGEYLRENHDKDLLTILVNIFENSEENEVIQECVYSALARASRQEWNDLLNDENKPNPKIMSKIYQILNEK